MEKYGVVTTEESSKEAEDKPKKKPECPGCKRALESGANVPKCPVHGTEPFEK
jgi:hypothetical protein